MIRTEDAEKNPSLFSDLFNSYCLELSDYNRRIFGTSDQNGNFAVAARKEYFSSPYKHPYIIYDDFIPVGMAVFSDAEPEEDDDCLCYIEELFILEPFRKSGIATRVVKDYFQKHSGKCGLCVLKNNEKAIRFWENLLGKSDLSFERSQCRDDSDLYFYSFNLK